MKTIGILADFRKIGTTLLMIVVCFGSLAQDVIEDEEEVEANERIQHRVWYKNYVSVKLHPKWSIDNSLMSGMRNVRHRFSFVQVGFGVTHRFNRFWSSRLAYEHTFFRHSGWWEENYDLEPRALNTVQFKSVSLNLKRRDNIGERFRLIQTIEGKFFTPRYQKFQTRLRYGVHFGYRKKNLPLRMRPFVSASVYYYLGGEEVEYESEEDVFEAAPNGLHRAFLRLGVNIKPIKSKWAPSITLYYGFNREFNFLFGNPLNVEVGGEEESEVLLPFNNYGVFGLQLNWFF